MQHAKRNAVIISLAASIVLALAKLIAGLWIDSLALITDALHSTTDFLATAVTWFAIREAEKPADDIHTYGHGKFENIAALGETALLLLLAGGVAVEAVTRISENHAVTFLPWPVFAILLVEIAINGWRAISMHRIAKETSSPALASNAAHFGADVLSTLAVLGGLFMALAGFQNADSIAAIIVALIIAFIALRLGKSTIDQLVDAAPKGLTPNIAEAVDDVPGVISVAALRMRRVGPTDFVEVTIDVARTLSAERIARVVDSARIAIFEHLPNADIQVETRPIAVDDETMLERIHLAAARARLPIHHVTIQNLEDKIAIALDLEVDGTMPLAQAHDIAVDLENALHEELGDRTEIEIHIEPARAEPVDSADITGDTHDQIQRDLERHAAAIGGISDIHRLRVRELGSGLFVAFHCRLHDTMSVSSVHAKLDDLERALRADWPQIRRIVSHADPLG